MSRLQISRRSVVAAPAGLAGGLAACATTTKPAGRRVEVLGHRGACALRPEHTLASYAQAVADGADFIEPDLVITKDGVLVARHENDMTETTDVATRPEFAARRTRKRVDGAEHTGWFVEDFTLAELKQLRAVERIPKIRPGNVRYNGQFAVPTFQEVVDFAAAESRRVGRPIGLAPELKSSTYFAGLGLGLEDRFLDAVGRHPHTRRHPLVIQSFEIANLKYVRRKLGRPANVRIAQLVTGGSGRPQDVVAAGSGPTSAEMLTPSGLAAIRTYADIFAPPTRAVIPLAKDDRLAAPTTLVADAHAAGLQVVIWTFRPENLFLAADFRNGEGESARNAEGSVAEMRRYLQTGVDGIFSDDPSLARRAVQEAARA